MPAAGDNEVLPIVLVRQRRDAVAGRVRDAARHLPALDLHGASPVVSVSAWNVATQDVAGR